jgi:sporulation protein YlmC with PRC-barrel domain
LFFAGETFIKKFDFLSVKVFLWVLKMYKYTIARQLASKRVITNRGDEVGKLIDLIVSEVGGDVEFLVVEVDRSSRLLSKLGKLDKLVEIPYSAVTAVSDVFIVDEREILEDIQKKD